MSVYCVVNARQKLHDTTRKIFLNEPLMYSNAQAHCFRLTLMADNGTDPADLTGVTATANFLRPDRSTVALTGTITGNVVEVVLPNACYSSVGRYKLTVDIGEGTGNSAATRTALIVEGITERNVTDTYVDPGTIMPSINTLIQEIDDAVNSIPTSYTALLDSLAQTFSATTNYKAGDFVWHGDLADGGKLYRFTEDHAAGAWTGTDVAEAVVTDGVEGDVRYDGAQSLTDAQQTQARTNIGAVSQTEHSSLDGRVNALRNLVDYGYSTDGHLNSSSTNPYAVDRIKTQITLNSTSASQKRYMRLTGSITRTSTNGGVADWTSGVQLVQGHTYILRSRLISGSVTINSTDSPQVNAYEAGTSTSLSTERSPAGDVVNFWRVFTAGSTPINIVHITLAGTTYTNAVYEITLEDISDVSNVYDRAIAPHNGLTASQAYTPGDLLMQNGRLMKATVDIASGEAISGKATETSVASQFAARDISISSNADNVAALATRMATAEGDIDTLEANAVRNTSPNLPYRIFDWRQLGSVLNDVPTGWGTGYYRTDDGTAANSTNSIRTRAAMDSRFLTARDLYAVVTPPSGKYVRVTIHDGATYKETLNTANTVDLPIRFEIKSGYRYLFTVGTFDGEAASYVTEEYTKQIVLAIYMSGENKTLANTAENYIWNSTDESVLKLPTSYTVTGEPTPLIVLCHGLNHSASASSWDASTPGKKLVNAGFAVMDVNQVTTADWYNPALIKKYIAALRNITQNYNVRADFVFGLSMGSGIALTLSTLIPGIKACVATGIRLDFASRYAAGSAEEKAIVDANLGFTDGYDPMIAVGWCKTATACMDGNSNTMNPVQFPPLLLLYGDSDTLTLTESLARAQEIKRGGTICQINEYTGDHAAMCNLTAGTSLADTVAWFNTWL